MKKVILGIGVFALSFGYFIPQNAMAMVYPCPDGSCQNEEYYAMSEDPDSGAMCCQKTTNSLNSCTGEVC